MNNQWNEIYKKDSSAYNYYDLTKAHEFMPKLLKVLKEHKANRILDLGCGSGRNFLCLHSSGLDVYGLDIAEEGIKTVKRSVKENIEEKLMVRDIYQKLPYSDNFFDAIISIQTLQHGTENQILSTIKEIKRVLKPGGIIFITVSGRISKGKIRYCLVKTAKKIAPHTYVPTLGDEQGLTHFIYTKTILLNHFRKFKIINLFKDSKDYYCLIAVVKK